MPCYCRKIRELQKKLEDLNKAQNHVSKAMNSSRQTNQMLQSAASTFEISFTFMGAESHIANQVKQVYEPAIGEISGACGDISKVISATSQEINSLTSADRQYHEEEYRRRQSNK